MEQLEVISQLRDKGLFRDALNALEKVPKEVDSRPATQVLRAELLAHVGRAKESRGLITRLFSARSLNLADRSLCDFVLARMELERGASESAISHLNRSITAATRAGHFERACAAQLKLLLVLSDGAGTDATGPLLSEVRANATKSGDARTLAEVHVYCAQIEALKSSVKTARRHIRLALGLLKDSPNVWLEAIIENIELALSVMASEFDAAEVHAKKGLELAQRCGGAIEFAVNQANSGYLWRLLGRLDEAVGCYERALELFIPGSENFNGTLDSLARVKLAQNRFDECEEILAKIEKELGPKGRATYVFRHVQLTRAQLFVRKGDFKQANHHVEHALRLARSADDRLLSVLGLLEKAEISVARGQFDDVLRILDGIWPVLSDHSAEVYARFERLLARTAARQSLNEFASDHFSRADRIYQGLHHQEGLADLRNCPEFDGSRSQTQPTAQAITSVLESVVAVLSLAKHPEFVARELVAILASIGGIEALRAVSRLRDGQEMVISEVQRDIEPNSIERSFQIFELPERTIELKVRCKDDLSSLATIQAASNLIARINELRLAREDRNERSTIWPADNIPSCANGALIAGHMAELMTYAQRVARTTVNVLITGESGTGKEIIARAIHDFSGRAHKPFVPFNCAAVPRDLIESQLFGHRRGAFTGAERDHLGLIRAAADGTLFLDEVGEMSLDLQPKLLRFLESGEISPLGEPLPSTVNVRVVAATNATLEDAVRDGRFREDLFYRLNVVRLSIRPLRERRDEIPGMVHHFVAAAARDYKKGHLQVAEETMERLLLFRWPGNVRQLQNEIRRMVALAEPNSTLEPDAISTDILGAMPYLRHASPNGREIAVPLHDKLMPTLSRIEYEMIKAALREHRGKLEPAARSLGISRKGLYLKRQRLGL